jgi:hypothetical protein
MIKVKQGRHTITTKIAYIAGFFDGEGCIRIKKTKNSYYLWVAITNSNKVILEEVKEMFGGQVRQAEKTVNKIVYHYLITCAEADDMLKVLIPFIKEKLPQALVATNFHKHKGKLTLEEKEDCYQTLIKLKKV